MNVSDIQPTLEQMIELKRNRAIDEKALRTLFLEARTANGFLDAPVSRDVLERAVEIAELGPTSANSLPVRYVFVTSPEAAEAFGCNRRVEVKFTGTTGALYSQHLFDGFRIKQRYSPLNR